MWELKLMFSRKTQEEEEKSCDDLSPTLKKALETQRCAKIAKVS
jgi:hypothetical protein